MVELKAQLDLSNNLFSGPIPSTALNNNVKLPDLSPLLNLRTLDLSGNPLLTGTVSEPFCTNVEKFASAYGNVMCVPGHVNDQCPSEPVRILTEN